MSSASTPGSGLPSISSSDAPPPVETWSTRSASPNCASAAARVAAADDRRGRASGDRLGDRARAGRERLELERAHRAVPEHRAGVARSPRRSARAVCGPMSSPIQPSGTSTPSSARVSVSARELAPERRGRSGSRSLLAARARARAARGSMPSSSHSESPTAWPCALKNGKHIAPPIRIASARCEERVEHADLVGHLGAADDRDERPLRVVEDARAASSTSRSSSRPAALGSRCATRLGRGVRAVRGAERVVDVDVGERRVALRRARGRSSSRPARSGRSRASRRRRPGTLVERRPRARPARRAARPGARRPAAARASGRGPSAGRGARQHAAARPSSRSSRQRRQRRADARVVGDLAVPSSGTLKSTRTRTRLPVDVEVVERAHARSTFWTRSTQRFE